MWKNIIQVLMAGVGTLGFTLFFLYTKTCGRINFWRTSFLDNLSCYLPHYRKYILGNMIASMIVCLWSELMARKLKAPTNIFMIPGIIPLLPGGTLYYTMEAMLQRNKKVFVQKGIETVMITVGIVAGIVAVSVILVYFLHY